MSCETNSNKEQSEEGKTTNLESPFHNEVECFDNAEAYPDMELVVKGIPKPLLLHRKIIANASGWFKRNLTDKWGQRLEWPFDTSKEVDREALLKSLRFCYGETQTVGTKNCECIAMAVVLSRLQVTCLEKAMTTLGNFATEQAKQKVETGVELLMMCSLCPECCGTSQSSLNQKLASVVLTKDNMVEHYKEVVDECLMMLPAEYLSMADFGAPHTRWSEFSLRVKYVQVHSKQMTQEEKLAMVGMCDWSMLNSLELRELRLANIIGKDELLDAQEKALESCETEKEHINEMLRKNEVTEETMTQAVNERDGAVERANQAFREREAFRVCLEKVEKEKNELKEQAGKEKDVLIKEINELKSCLERFKKEKEEETKRANKAEAEKKQFRIRAEKAEKEKDEKVHEVESLRKKLAETEGERDTKANEVDLLKKRLEDMENEREKHWSRVDGLESFVKDNRLFFDDDRLMNG